MITDATAGAGGTMGTPTMPQKGVIKARARGRLDELRAMLQAAATPSPKAAADAHRTEQQSQKKVWMKDAMNKRVKNKKIADIGFCFQRWRVTLHFKTCYS